MFFVEKWIELGIIMLNDVSQAQNVKYNVFLHIRSLEGNILKTNGIRREKRG